MSNAPEPLRWLDPASEIPPELRQALVDARADVPSAEVLARIKAGAVAKAAAAKLGLLIKLILGSAVLGGLGLWFWLPEQPPASTARPAAIAPLLPTAAPEPPPPPIAEPADTRDVAAPLQAPARAIPPSSPPIASELDLLESAQRALSEDPREAFRLTQLSRRHHPRGNFVPEREALAVQALLGLGRRNEAEVRYRILRAEHPNAAVLPRLEALFGNTDAGATASSTPP